VRLVLASASPRRIDLLRKLGVAFTIRRPRVGETPPRPLRPLRHVEWAAAQKAGAVARRARGAVVLAADTMVVLDGRAMGKPGDPAHATRMLTALRGRTHTVLTAVHVINTRTGAQAGGVSRTRVTMRRTSLARLKEYVRGGEAQDKAGAYAIQGAGSTLVSHINGPFDNVVGMPLHLVRRLLREVGFALPQARRRA